MLAAATLWATFGLFAKRLYTAGFTPLELASIRTWIGWLGLALLAASRPQRLRITRRDLPFFALYGIGAFALFEVLFLIALERTGVAIAAAMLYTAPAFVVLISAIVLREHLPLRQWLALLLVLVGVTLVTGAAGAVLTGTAPLSGMVLLVGLGSGFAYGCYTIFSKRAAGRYDDEIFVVFWMFAFATLGLTLVQPPFAAMARPHGEWPALLGLGIVPTLLPYILYLTALRWLHASTAAMLASVEPVMAALLALALLGETLDPPRIAGIVLIAAAAALLTRKVEQVEASAD